MEKSEAAASVFESIKKYVASRENQTPDSIENVENNISMCLGILAKNPNIGKICMSQMMISVWILNRALSEEEFRVALNKDNAVFVLNLPLAQCSDTRFIDDISDEEMRPGINELYMKMVKNYITQVVCDVFMVDGLHPEG